MTTELTRSRESETPGPSPAALAELREQREAIRMQHEIAVTQRELELIDQERRYIGPLFEGWGDIVDRTDYLYDDPSFGYGSVYDRIDIRGDRRGGQDRVYFQTEQDLAFIRGMAKFLTATVPPAIGAMKNLTNYIVGTTWGYEVAADHDGSAEVAKVVKEFVDEWVDQNDWVGIKDRESFRRTVRDGESLNRLQLVPGSQGMTRVRFEEPAELCEPLGSRDLEDWLGTSERFVSCWRFGVHTKHGDTEFPLGYHLVHDGTGDDWEYVPASHIEHIKAVVDSKVKRGVSEFYGVKNHFQSAEKVFENTAHGAAIQAAIAGVREFDEGQTKTSADSLLSSVKTQTRTQTTETGSRTVQQQKFNKGSIINAKGYKWGTGPMGSQRNPALIEAGQAVLRLVGTRWCMPEWMTSGDASNNNFASSLVAESPFVESCKAEQHFYRRHWSNLIWKAIKIAYQAGRFDRLRVSWEELRYYVQLNVTPKQVESRDRTAETQRNQILNAAGVKSKRTWAGEEDLDYEAERENIDSEPVTPGAGAGLGGGLGGGLDAMFGAAVQESVSTPEEGLALLQNLKEGYP